MTLCRRNTILESVPWMACSSWNSTLQGPSTSQGTLLQELQRNMDTVRCATSVAEVAGYRHDQSTQTLSVCLLKTHLFKLIRKFGGIFPNFEPVKSQDQISGHTCEVFLTWLLSSVRNLTTIGSRYWGTTWNRRDLNSWQYMAMWGTCSISSALTLGSVRIKRRLSNIW